MPNLMQAIKQEVQDSKKVTYTGFPATIVSYDNQFCRVKPAINLRYQDGDVVSPPDIDGVPFNFQGGGGGILSFPIQVGDVVWVQCSMVALDEWLQQYSESFTPSTRRMHSLNDAVVTSVISTKDQRLGVDPENIELKFHKPKPDNVNLYDPELISSFKMLKDGSVELTTSLNQNIKLNPDKSITIESVDAGNKIDMLADGNIEITTAASIKIQNSGEELINLVSELMALLGDTSQTTTNTMIGPMPLNSAPAIKALQSRLDTLKG